MIRHILKNGHSADITGHVVKVEDAEEVYVLISTINSGWRFEKHGDF